MIKCDYCGEDLAESEAFSMTTLEHGTRSYHFPKPNCYHAAHEPAEHPPVVEIKDSDIRAISDKI